MKRRERDFVALFNAFWYRDFPVTPQRLDISRRALWTTHIASTVKLCADHLGLFTCFETGGKTDAVIQDANSKNWAKVEWEWMQPKADQVNEIKKLADAKDEADAFIFIGYSRSDEPYYELNLRRISEQWRGIDKPLIVFLVTFSRRPRGRQFELLQTRVFVGSSSRMLRKQEALPWQVKGTKWHAQATAAVGDS